MNDYMEVRLSLTRNPNLPETADIETATDLLAALLADEGYESFQPDNEGLTAWIRSADYSEDNLQRAISALPLTGFAIEPATTLIEGRDWNHEWEQHYFKPIVVGKECVIHSSFHTDFPACRYDIVIDPKMAFGTGHHATTSLIIEALLGMDLNGVSVIDMGTGTAILAILAAMRGASPVVAIEIDEAAVDNARDNVVTNRQPEIEVLHGDAALLEGRHCRLFLANINRNVITADLPAYVATLESGGTMLLSGFYEHDIPVVEAAAAPLGLVTVGHTVKEGGWTCLRLVKQ